jgi:hypothetical protein
VGTPFCVTVDFETFEGVKDGPQAGQKDTVTIRHRGNAPELDTQVMKASFFEIGRALTNQLVKPCVASLYPERIRVDPERNGQPAPEVSRNPLLRYNAREDGSAMRRQKNQADRSARSNLVSPPAKPGDYLIYLLCEAKS